MLRFVTPPYLYRAFYSDLVWNMDAVEKTIYLTFDDGPTPNVTEQVLNLLKAHQAKATFFCLGKNVKENPELFQSILNHGHAIGNHTYSHVNGWNASLDTYLEDVDKCSELVQSKLFRPPYGKLKPSQRDHLLNKFKIIMWSVLSYDFDTGVYPEICWNYVKENTKAGSVIVFHDSLKAKQNLLFALPRLLEHYSKQGYTFKSIESERN